MEWWIKKKVDYIYANPNDLDNIFVKVAVLSTRIDLSTTMAAS